MYLGSLKSCAYAHYGSRPLFTGERTVARPLQSEIVPRLIVKVADIRSRTTLKIFDTDEQEPGPP